MARSILSITRPTRDGVPSPTEVDGDPVNGHVVPVNLGRTIITIRNADTAAAHQVTFILPGTVDGQQIADRVVSIPASSSRDFAGFPADAYGAHMGVDVDSTELKLSARGA